MGECMCLPATAPGRSNMKKIKADTMDGANVVFDESMHTPIFYTLFVKERQYIEIWAVTIEQDKVLN